MNLHRLLFHVSLGLEALNSAWAERWQQDLSRRRLGRRHLDSVLRENEGLRSSMAELQTRLENADRAVQELQSAKEGFGRWGLWHAHACTAHTAVPLSSPRRST